MTHTIKIISSLLMLFAFLGGILSVPQHVAADIGDEGGIIMTMNDKVTISYYSGIDENVAKWVKGAIEKAWPLYTQKSGKELEKLDLQIGHLMYRDSETGEVDEPYGLTTFSYPTNTCNIVISTVDSTKKVIEATTVHELMHCWQYDMRWYSNGDPTNWMAEATAVWSEDWLYTHNTEFEYLKERFGSFNSDFFSSYGNREYGAYLYFKFLSQKGWITPEGVFELLKAQKNKSQEIIMGSQTDLHTILKEYAMWNLNFGEYRKYTDPTPGFPKILPRGNSKMTQDIKNGEDTTIDFNMFRGGTKYIVLYIDDDVKKLEFTTREYNSLLDEDISLQALVKIDGEYTYEDWSHLEFREFCRNREAEKVDKIILIVNHSNLLMQNEMHSGSIPVRTTEECPVQWTGTTVYKKSGGDGVLPVDEEIIMREVLVEMPDDDGNIDLAIKEQTITVSGKTSTVTGCLFSGCSGSMGGERTYSGTTYRTLSLDPQWPIYRFAYNGESDPYTFVGTDQVYGECDYVTETIRSFANCSCPGVGSSNMDDTTTETGSCHDGPNYEIEVPVEYIPGKTKKIEGSTGGNSPEGYYEESFTWSYVYE